VAPGIARASVSSAALFERRAEVDMQDNVATAMTLQALREIGEGLRAISEELHRLNDHLKNNDSVVHAPSSTRSPKYPHMLPR
jgi:hypothetical protein